MFRQKSSKDWQYGYDPCGRKTKEVATSVYTNSFTKGGGTITNQHAYAYKVGNQLMKQMPIRPDPPFIITLPPSLILPGFTKEG